MYRYCVQYTSLSDVLHSVVYIVVSCECFVDRKLIVNIWASTVSLLA